VQRLLTSGAPASDLARNWASAFVIAQVVETYRKRTAAGTGVAHEPAAAREELPAKPSSEHHSRRRLSTAI